MFRPFFLSRFLNEIVQLYQRVQNKSDQELKSALDISKKRNAGDQISKIFYSEDQIEKSIKDTQADKKHELEVYGKFVRLKERFNRNPKKMAEVIAVYKRYLEVKLKQCHASEIFTRATTSGAFIETHEVLEASDKEVMIILQENEGKLDALLSDHYDRLGIIPIEPKQSPIR